MLIDVLTDNSQRSVSDVRSIMRRHGGSLGAPGCVTWMFEQKGVIVLSKEAAAEDALFALAVEAGAEELREEDGSWEVFTAPGDFAAVAEALREAGLAPERAELTMVPSSTTAVPDAEAPKLIRLLDELNDHDDVQQVYANFEISDEAMERLAG